MIQVATNALVVPISQLTQAAIIIVEVYLQLSAENALMCLAFLSKLSIAMSSLCNTKFMSLCFRQQPGNFYVRYADNVARLPNTSL
jgi:hypothetical protein